jgi:hypothetical protein
MNIETVLRALEKGEIIRIGKLYNIKIGDKYYYRGAFDWKVGWLETSELSFLDKQRIKSGSVKRVVLK